MSSTWELKGKLTGELTATVEGDTWKDAQKKVFRKLVKEVNLPGFRPGQALERLIGKQISPQNMLMEVVDEAAGDVLSAGIKKHDLWVISCPASDIEGINGDKVAFKLNVAVKPEVRLGVYKDLDIIKEVAEVSDTDVEEETTRLQRRFTDLAVEKEGKVENGDIAVTDLEGFREGVVFEGGRGEAYPLVTGSGSFVSGFEEQVLGMGVEKTRDINVIFPESYQAEEPAGQPVVFKAIVHEIKPKVSLEADDELVKQAEVENVETLKTFKEYPRKNLGGSKKNQAGQKFENEILTAITENAEVEIPQVMIEEETDNLVRDFEQRLQSQGLGLEQFKQVAGQTDEMIREEMDKDAFNKVEVRLVLEAIAVEEKIEASEEDVNSELENIANMYQMPVEQVKQLISNDAVSYDSRIRRALELVKEVTDK